MKRSVPVMRLPGRWHGGGWTLPVLLVGLALALGQGSLAVEPGGGFEDGLDGLIVSGDVHMVPGLGILRAPQGAQAALLTTAPDAGTEPADASLSTLTLPAVTVPGPAGQLRFEAAFLTDGPTASLTNDRLTVVFHNTTTAVDTIFEALDTFGPFYAAPLDRVPRAVRLAPHHPRSVRHSGERRPV